MLRAKHFWLSARAELGVIGKKHARPNRLLNYCSVPNTEGVIISGAHQRHPVRVVRYCVAVEQEDRARDPRTYGLIYTAVNPEHFRPMFLEFLRQSKTSLLNSQGKCAKLMDNNARYNRSSPSVFGAEQHLCKRPSALAVLPKRQTGENTRDPKYLGRVSSLTKSHLATPSNRIQPDHFPKMSHFIRLLIRRQFDHFQTS